MVYGLSKEGDVNRSIGLMLSLFALTACCVVLGGCDSGVVGSGIAASERRALEPYKSVEIRGTASVNIASGDSDIVTITTDDNLLTYIATTVEDCVLTISTEERLGPSQGVSLQLQARDLQQVVVHGVAEVNVTGVDTEKFTVVTSGAGDIRVSGRAVVAEVKVNGAGDVNMRELISQGVAVKVNGAGDVQVYATTLFSAMINGVGDITCYGNPEHVERRINGIGDITIAE